MSDQSKKALPARLDAEFGSRVWYRAMLLILVRMAGFTALVVIGSRFLPG